VVDSEHGTELFLRAFAGTEDARIDLRRSSVGSLQEPERVGRDLAALLLADGAVEIPGLRSESLADRDASPDQPAGQPPDPPEASPSEGPIVAVTAQSAFTPPASSYPDRSASESAS
jgi:hydroxymethylbilane synthase